MTRLAAAERIGRAPASAGGPVFTGVGRGRAAMGGGSWPTATPESTSYLARAIEQPRRRRNVRARRRRPSGRRSLAHVLRALAPRSPQIASQVTDPTAHGAYPLGQEVEKSRRPACKLTSTRVLDGE